jgi:PhzF family phenazine biosynthesis protein
MDAIRRSARPDLTKVRSARRLQSIAAALSLTNNAASLACHRTWRTALRSQQIHRLSAFADQAGGGNPAGVWIGEQLPESAIMQRIAAEIGYSETAFIAPLGGAEREIRYYSPLAEVSFCGHATIASGVVLGRLSGPGTYLLHTRAGEVPVRVVQGPDGLLATLTSVETRFEAAGSELLAGALAALDWQLGDLDPTIPPAIAYAGAQHLVLAVTGRERLDRLEYDFAALKALMEARGLTTLQLIWREHADLFHARNPFPVGGVIEDPATGASAAALGGYLRDAGLLAAPAEFEILQGVAMGRPSRLRVRIPASGGIEVSGGAIDIQGSQRIPPECQLLADH